MIYSVYFFYDSWDQHECNNQLHQHECDNKMKHIIFYSQN